MSYKIKIQSTNDNDSVEEALIAMRNIKTVDGKILDRTTQAKALMGVLVKFGHFEELNVSAREWQGLTDDEIDKIYADTEPDSKMDTYYMILSRAIEAKLKEKNNG